MLSSGLADTEDLVWWQPYQSQPPTGDGCRRSKAWLPAAIEVDSHWQASQVRSPAGYRFSLECPACC